MSRQYPDHHAVVLTEQGVGVVMPDAAGHHYRCPGCERPARSLEHDGYCRRCATGEDEYDPACVTRANAKIMGRWGRR